MSFGSSFSFLDNESSQSSDEISASCVCRIISCILHNQKLTKVRFHFGPSFCSGDDAWRREGLPVPPREVWVGGWTPTLSFIRVRCAYVTLASRHVVFRHHAALTTFADASGDVPRQHDACARRRTRSCRVPSLQRVCSCCAAACAPGDYAVTAPACTCVAAGQGLPGQGAAAAAVLRLPPVCPAASPGHCCRPQRSHQH